MKNKKNIIFIVVSMIFVISFLLLNKTNNVRQIKVKELNYNVTYKEAFPDENLRRGVVLCIMRDKCKDSEAQYFRYDGNLSLYDNSNFLTDSRLGAVITEDEIKAIKTWRDDVNDKANLDAVSGATITGHAGKLEILEAFKEYRQKNNLG